jgi:CRISPR/Cas system CSM-associated protein Csm3 (group 7 of RAMP superfamily)
MNVSLPFKGNIYILPNAPKQTRLLILAALKHINALGGSKSTGLGWLSWKDFPSTENCNWQDLLSK